MSEQNTPQPPSYPPAARPGEQAPGQAPGVGEHTVPVRLSAGRTVPGVANVAGSYPAAPTAETPSTPAAAATHPAQTAPAAPAAASAAPAQQGAAFWQPGVSVAEPGYTESTASAAFPGAAGAPGAASGAPAVATATSGAVTPKPRRSWPAVAAAAMLAAVLASGGTALATGAFDQSAAPSAYSDLGTTTQVAASTTTDVDWQSLASQVRDSVVAITVVMSGGTAAGSGVVIDAGNGYVVTNNHVVSGATSGGITVTLADGRIFDATIVGTDPTTDIAVVKLTDPPSDLKAAQWGDSSQVLVGEDVMAVGNPLGLASTVTTGIVSAVDRPVSTTGEESSASSAPVVTNAIQIDAAINPGNSGGPLFNTSGEVIGINSSIATTSSESGSIGLGFAIPANQAKDVAEQLISSGTAEHAYLGVTLSDATATADGTTRAGAKIESVSSGTPAAEAGLKAGDVVVGINSKAVSGAESLTGFVRQFSAGDEVTLTVVRNGEAIDVNVSLAVRPETDTASGSTGSGSTDQGQSDQGQSGQIPGLPGFGGGGNG